MIQRIILYASLIAIPISGWLGYDYGSAKAKEQAQVAADKLTDRSVVLADKSEAKKVERQIVYRDVIRKVEVSRDTECLDSHPPDAISDGVRLIQSSAR